MEISPTADRDPSTSPSPFDEEFAARLVEASPLAVIVLDAEGVVTFASARAARLIGLSPLDVIGQPIFGFLHPDDLERCLDIFSFGREYTQSIMGPVHIRYLDAEGLSGYVDLWTNNCLDDPEIAGLVCILNEETTSSHLANAVSAIAANEPIEQTLRTVAEAMRGHPIEGTGVILGTIDDDITPLTPSVLAGELRAAGDTPGPWTTVARTGVGVDIDDLGELPPAVRRAAEAAGFRAVWLRPITVASDTDVQAILVVWSRLSGAPSPNQEDHLREAVSIASLAFGRMMLIERLTHAAHHDELTGLANRSKLASTMAAPASEAISVLYMDLDRFKDVNDRMGHDAGDEVLVAVAKRIASTLRNHDDVARVGGDEFVAVLRQLPSPQVAETVAERIAMAVGHPIAVGDHQVSVGVSIGIAHGQTGDDFAELVRAADQAMLETKRSRTEPLSGAEDH